VHGAEDISNRGGIEKWLAGDRNYERFHARNEQQRRSSSPEVKRKEGRWEASTAVSRLGIALEYMAPTNTAAAVANADRVHRLVAYPPDAPRGLLPPFDGQAHQIGTEQREARLTPFSRVAP